jgi:hypothetical protein
MSGLQPARFAAVTANGQAHFSSVNTYYYSRRQSVLLHQATYLAPTVQTDPRPDALTGTNALYSPHMEREFQYGCALLEVTP